MSTVLEESPPLELVAADPGDHVSLRKLLSLALPTILQMSSYLFMQFVDTLMLGQVGDLHATAAANSGMITWSCMAPGMGTLALVTTLVSQSLGRQHLTACGQYLRAGMLVAIAYGLLLWPLAIATPTLVKYLPHSVELSGLEGRCIRICLMLAFLKLLQSALSGFLMGIQRPRMVSVSAIIGVGANLVAAWALIFGHWGFPAMGAVGGAWALNIGCLVELLVLAYAVFGPSAGTMYQTRGFLAPWSRTRELVRLGIPSGLQWLGDISAWTVFTVMVVGHFGDTAMAAHTYTFRYMQTSFMPAFGIGSAITSLVGQSIGAGKKLLARKWVLTGLAVVMAYMVVCGIIFATIPHLLISAFTTDPKVVEIGCKLMIIAGLFQLCDALFVIYSSALRGAGDTLFPAVAAMLLGWGLIVGLGYATAILRPEWGPAGVWMIALCYGCSLGALLVWRWYGTAWEKISVAE